MASAKKNINYIELTFNTNLSILDLIQPIADRICEQVGFDEDSKYWIWLSIQEALNNAIKHGNKMNAEKKVTLIISVKNREFKIEVGDEGEGFDFSLVPDPTKTENLLKTSGRGLFYMKSFMDRVECSSKNGTKLTLVKKL